MSYQPGTPPYVLENKGEFDAPLTLTVPASLEIRPDTATAKFDGTGASGAFLACLTFYGTNGERLCRMFSPTILQPGDVAEVTYIPPFGSAATSAATSAGIQFDTDNEGGWLDVTANNKDASGRGIFLADASGGFTRITNGSQRLDLSRGGNTALLLGNQASLEGNPSATMLTTGSAANVNVNTVAGLGNVSISAKAVGGEIIVQDLGTTSLISIISTRLGFYNQTPATRQTITGSRAGNAAVASLLTALALIGLIIDGTTP